MQNVLNKESLEFNAFSKEIQTLIKNTTQLDWKHTMFRTYILSLEWWSSKKNGVQVDLKVVINNRDKLGVIINNIRNATLIGKLDKLTLKRNVFEAMDERTNQDTMQSKKKRKEERLDIVELIVTCVAAFIVILSIAWCFFYLCTTPAERERCNCCGACRNNRTAHA